MTPRSSVAALTLRRQEDRIASLERQIATGREVRVARSLVLKSSDCCDGGKGDGQHVQKMCKSS
jgi:hypothetical protein